MEIKFIDIMEKDIYIEFANSDSEYISFTKAKKLIYKKLPRSIMYNCTNSEKSVAFLNVILNKYNSINNLLILK